MATTRGTAGPPGSSPSQASIPGNAFALCYPLANLDGSGLCAASEVANRNGGRSRARTCDPGLVRAVLFQLSYPPVSRIVGGDPDTVNRRARLQGRRPYVLYSSATRGACAVAAARSASAPARSP